MGRAERRAAERARRKSEIRMTPERIQDLKQRTAKEAARQVDEMQRARESERVQQALVMLILFGMTWKRDMAASAWNSIMTALWNC